MRIKEECKWCMSTLDIIRKISPDMPEEFKQRCSACHEIWNETHYQCDKCLKMIDNEVKIIHHDKYTDTYTCDECKDEHGYI